MYVYVYVLGSLGCRPDCCLRHSRCRRSLPPRPGGRRCCKPRPRCRLETKSAFAHLISILYFRSKLTKIYLLISSSYLLLYIIFSNLIIFIASIFYYIMLYIYIMLCIDKYNKYIFIVY